MSNIHTYYKCKDKENKKEKTRAIIMTQQVEKHLMVDLETLGVQTNTAQL
jgi:hypothetical protein